MLLLNKLYSSVWAATPDAIRQIEEVLKNKLELKKLSREDYAEAKQLVLESVEARTGKPLNNNPRVTVRGTTAVIPVIGSIVKRGSMFTEVSGLTSTDRIAKDFAEALTSEDINSIVFNFSSGGGEAEGISELADMIFKARGVKPIKAYVEGSAQSAAYWLASACDEIVANDTAELGSIGVAVFIEDDTEAMNMAGYKRIVLKSTRSPNKLPDPTTDEGATLIIERLNAMHEVFLKKVSKYRTNDKNGKMTPDRVVKEFKEGGTVGGVEAVRIGMADRLGDFEGLLKELNTMKKEGITPENSVAEEEKAGLEPGFAVATLSNVISEEDKNKLKQFDELSAKMAAMEEALTKTNDALARAETEKLELKANTVATELGIKAEQKPDFVKVYMTLSENPESLASYMSIVSAKVEGTQILSDEQLVEMELTPLPAKPADEADSGMASESAVVETAKKKFK